MQDRILIVEDDLELAEMLKLYFGSRGYQVDTIAFGEDAVAQASTAVPDVVILDIFLPDIDGYEVCRRLRSQQRTSQIPILFLTGKRGRDAKIAGLELGAVDYITKPFDLPELALRVENALRRAGFRPLDHPVSGLPGERLLQEHLATLRAQSGWCLTRLELEGLSEVADAYGFVVRDDILRAIALALKEMAAEWTHPAGFVAHVEQFIFYMIMITGEDCSATLNTRLAEKLRRTIAPFYPHKDLEAARAGHGRVPPLRIYAGSLSAGDVPPDRWDNLLQMASQARQLIAAVP